MYVVQKNSQNQTKEADVNVGVVEKLNISKLSQIIDHPSKWKVYRNKKYGFEIKYPPSFSLIEEDKEYCYNCVEAFLIKLSPPPSFEFVISIAIDRGYNPEIQTLDPTDEAFQFSKLRYINGIQWLEVCCYPGLYSNLSLFAGHKSMKFEVSLDAQSDAASNFYNLDSTDSEIILIFKKIMETFQFF
jgi:hypothetical protein